MNPGMSHIPYPPPPLSYMPSISDVISQVRKYDGKSDPEIWVVQLQSDLRNFNISYEWACRNLDRFLVGDALKWYSSNFHSYFVEFLNVNTTLEWQFQFNKITDSLRRFFDQSSQQALNKVKNRKIIFKLGDDPQSYVASKLDILRLCDPFMGEGKKVRQLIKGLPFELQQILSLQSITTCDDFLLKLRSLSEVYEENKGNSNHSSSLNHHSNQNRGSHAQNTAPKSRSDASLFMLNATPNPNHFRRDSRPKGQNNRTPDGQVICDFCYKVGHIKKYCSQNRQNAQAQVGHPQTNNRRYPYPQARPNFPNRQNPQYNNLEQQLAQFFSRFVPNVANPHVANPQPFQQPQSYPTRNNYNPAFRNNANRSQNLHSLFDAPSENPHAAGCGTSSAQYPQQ